MISLEVQGNDFRAWNDFLQLWAWVLTPGAVASRVFGRYLRRFSAPSCLKVTFYVGFRPLFLPRGCASQVFCRYLRRFPAVSCLKVTFYVGFRPLFLARVWFSLLLRRVLYLLYVCELAVSAKTTFFSSISSRFAMALTCSYVSYVGGPCPNDVFFEVFAPPAL